MKINSLRFLQYAQREETPVWTIKTGHMISETHKSGKIQIYEHMPSK